MKKYRTSVWKKNDDEVRGRTGTPIAQNMEIDPIE